MDYRISGNTMTAIADMTRAMAGTTKKMTPAEIIYWLGRVKYIPQGLAIGEFPITSVSFIGNASGRLPNVAKGVANSIFTSPAFESSAIGTLQEE